MVVLIVIFGVLGWIAFDYMQSRAFKKIFYTQLFERLTQQAMADRISFNGYIRDHYQLITLFFAQRNFSDYVEKQMWSAEDEVQVKYHHRPPLWFPPAPILRSFIQPRYVFLLDAQSRAREVYSRVRALSTSTSLLQPSQLLLTKSHGQSFLVNIDGAPYVVASSPYMDSQGRLRATLMVASPIDEEFLLASVAYHPGHIVALVVPGEDPQVLKVQVSSNLEEIPVGASVKELKDRYLVTGEEFFDYGASDIYIRLVSFISVEEVESLTNSVISAQQKQRLYTAPVFILTFILIVLWITRRIERLTRYVIDFSQNKLGIKQEGLGKGDQIYVLESRFQRLTEDVLQSRETLIREGERRLVVEKKYSESKHKERQLSLLHAVTEAVGVGVITTTSDGLKTANHQMENFAQKCGGLSVFDIKDADSEDRSLIDKDGNKRIFHISSPKIFGNGERIFLVQDVTEIRAHTEALEHMALHDALTGLSNRILFYDRLNQSLLARQRERRSLALMMIDIDRFKEINDTLGHHAGDIVLKEIGARLHNALRQSDTIARFGGDEFAVLLPVSDLKDAEQVTSRLLNTMKQPIIADGNSLYVGISIGIALYPLHGEDADDLVKHADMAMYAAKAAHSGSSVYNPEQEHTNAHRIVLMGELQRAIEQDKELTLYYQPKISHKTNSISGVEALVRWLHPQQGLILPDSFISLAEHAGLIKPLTAWILNNAMRQCAEWHRTGIEISVSVNLSARNLQDLHFPEQVSEILKTWGVEPVWLELEITESAMMVDHTRAMEILGQLSNIGVRLSIDNFGTGYSSLVYLKNLRVDEIKIFKSFVINMSKDENDAMIVRSIIELAHNLGLKVIAVGVESQEVMESLERLSCDALQGNHICPPLPAEELTRWLSESKWKASV
jgi:diguanylate cyclase (GGDEF)-like protein